MQSGVTAPPRSSRLNLRNPDPFDGSDPSKLPLFLSQCGLHFAERQQDFPSDDNQIIFVLSYLKGPAAAWFQPAMFAQDNTVPDWDGDFTLFVQELMSVFGPHDRVGDAEGKLRVLRMKSTDQISTYTVEFNTLAAFTNWGEAALKSQYYEGLPSRIKN